MTRLPVTMKFFGATGTVTGSKTGIFAGSDIDDRILIDCGLFQGPKEFRLRNWQTLPFDPQSIGSVILTHAHIDHSGYLPRLVKQGFKGPIYCSSATAELLQIMLLDSAHLQEEEASFANRHGFSKHKPAKPLYHVEDAEQTLEQLRPISLNQEITNGKYIRFRLIEAGHILGSAMVSLSVSKNRSEYQLLFSGDIGRYGVPILPNPGNPDTASWVVMESTYGDRLHEMDNLESRLAELIVNGIRRGGVILIPAFAVGRTQYLLYLLRHLQNTKDIPKIPIYIDSPMAIQAFQTHKRHIKDMDIETQYLRKSGDHPLTPENLHLCPSRDESKALNFIKDNAIIISASGMATGGRILHHLKLRMPHKENTLIFIGYQGIGTRGRTILEGSETVKIHGAAVPIKADVHSIDGFSAHADQDELMTWIQKFPQKPQKIFINHGEPESSQAIAELIS
ncbi:MBL fold metallo-hydrolase, partial [bacterium]|nr:MBL fold metallo-hydrolase [candidate division CSSED10-310 bacterium]